MIDIKDKTYLQELSILSSSKTLFLLKGKIASTYVTRVLNNQYSIDVELNPNNFIDYTIGNNFNKETKNNIRTVDYFESWARSNFDKDVVTFIRNPIERYLSGFIEDYVGGRLYQGTSLFTDYWLRNNNQLKFDSILIERFIDTLSAIQQNSENEAEKNIKLTEFIPIWEELIYFFLKEFLKSKFKLRDMHRSSWITFVYMLKTIKNHSLHIYDINHVEMGEIMSNHCDNSELKIKELEHRYNDSNYFSNITHKIYENSNYIRKTLDDILYDEIILYKELIKQK